VRRVLPFIVPGAVLLVWELAAQSGAISRIVCPSLLAIARELGSFLIRGDQLVEAWFSLYRALAGFVLAALVGVPLGLALGRSRRAARIVDPLLSATYPVPKIALFPVLVFALGIGSLSKITLVLLECLYPIVINAAQGARAVNRVLVWSSHNMGASRLQILGKIVLPAAAPSIFTGFRVALPVALVVVIITEMIGSADGLGYFVMAALADLRTDRLLAAVVVTAALGWALDWLVVAARAQLVFWERHETYFN
jgi:NitT/TauT family transport system permease protein